MINGGETVTGQSRRTNARALLVGVAMLVVVLLALATAFLLDRVNRPPVGIGQAPTAGIPAQPPSPQAAATDSAPIRSLADVDRLRSPVEQAVARAYLRYWDVYAVAMETRSTARLAEVTAGGRLQEATDEVGDLLVEGIAARIQVSHSFTLHDVGENDATIRDEYVNSSYVIDPLSRQPIGDPGTSQRIVNSYFLRRLDGVWKIVGGRNEAG